MIKKILFTLAILSSLVFSANVDKFELKDIYSKTTTVIGKKNGLEIPDAKGKVVLIEFWGTHCPPCMFSIPHYIELNKEYKDKLAMYAIEVQATPKEALIKFAKDKGINYNLYTQDDNMDFVRYIAQRASWRGSIPFLVILDTNGDVVDIKTGMVSKEYLQKVIEYLLNKKDKAVTKDNNSSSK